MAQAATLRSELTGDSDVLQRLDASEISPLHWKIMFISGMGFFTDAYDLFIIGVVMSLLKEQWQISPTAEGLVTSTALLASAVGAFLFGRVADMLGRKRIYGYEVLVLAASAIASALSACSCFPSCCAGTACLRLNLLPPSSACSASW
jgi:MFS family permease